MITDKQSYRSYVKEDLKAHGLSRVGVYDYWWRDCLRFQLRLRRIEYFHNTAGHNPLKQLWRFVLEVVNHRLGPGLHIVHYGTIVVHPDARVGKNCRLHPSTSIGDFNGVPRLGDNVYIGPGAKIYGPVTLGDNVAVGANAVVNKSFGSNVTLGGVPARIIAEKGAMEQGVFSGDTLNATNKDLPQSSILNQ